MCISTFSTFIFKIDLFKIFYRQYYAYLTDTQCKRVGTQCWVFGWVVFFLYVCRLMILWYIACKELNSFPIRSIYKEYSNNLLFYFTLIFLFIQCVFYLFFKELLPSWRLLFVWNLVWMSFLRPKFTMFSCGWSVW